MEAFRWSVLAAALLVAVVSAGFMFRYEPLNSDVSPMALTFVWDRWEARTCLIGLGTNYKLLCTPDEISRMGK
jgi:hypothetical protein